MTLRICIKHTHDVSDAFFVAELARLEICRRRTFVSASCAHSGTCCGGEAQAMHEQAGRFALNALSKFSAAYDPHSAAKVAQHFARLLSACPPDAASTLRTMGREALGEAGMKQIEELASGFNQDR